MWVLTTIKHVDDGFLGHFLMLGNYQTLWDGPVVLVAYSFKGFILKKIVVEAHKHVYKRQINNLDVEVQKCRKTFLNNVKGVVFYGVPHVGGTQDLSKYFSWQCQQIHTFNKYTTQSNLLKILESFNLQLEQLLVDFNNVIHEDLNIYAFGEGLPLNMKWVKFSPSQIQGYSTRFISRTFLYYHNLC
jgi:hypothetical protein